MRQRRLRKAVRKVGSSATVSGLALIGCLALAGSFAQAGIKPHRSMASFRSLSSDKRRTTATSCEGAMLCRGLLRDGPSQADPLVPFPWARCPSTLTLPPSHDLPHARDVGFFDGVEFSGSKGLRRNHS